LLFQDAVNRCDLPREKLQSWIRDETEKQLRWLEHRAAYRLGRRFTRSVPDKPLSRSFHDTANIQDKISLFRSRRKAAFLREYPAPEGDPRVFWWKLLSCFAPKSGKVLNVGALPPESRQENEAFLGKGVEIAELDIDPGRRPDILCDICNPPEELKGNFNGVLLFGLPYFHSPGRAVHSCFEALKRRGVGLFGFPDDTHPFRGSLWNPIQRPIWRPQLEPLEHIGLKGNLWSFDREAVNLLFYGWKDVWVENCNHYWFVAARKGELY